MLSVDTTTSHQNKVSYARVLIEVDVTKEFLEEILIKGVNGLNFTST